MNNEYVIEIKDSDGRVIKRIDLKAAILDDILEQDHLFATEVRVALRANEMREKE